MYSFPSKGPIRSRLSYWTRYPYQVRLGWGLFWGWFSAAGLSAYVIVVAIARGSTHFARSNLTLAQILVGYWSAGTAVGFVLAFAHPLIRSRLGSFTLGFVLAWIVYSITGFFTPNWTSGFLLFAIVPALLVGGGLGVVFYDDEHKHT